MCGACCISVGESIEIDYLDCNDFDFAVFMDHTPNEFRLRLTDGSRNKSRIINNCPWCGHSLKHGEL